VCDGYCQKKKAPAISAMVGGTSGCDVLDRDEAIEKIYLQAAPRGAVVHTGLTVKTSDGEHYSLAYNAIVNPITGGPGTLWCQSGKPPFSDFRANGDWPAAGDKTWHASATKDGAWKSLKDFRKDVEAFASAHPTYNLAACDIRGGGLANCQLTAASLWKSVVGSDPPVCEGCEPSCFH
jgi:hypothetical protein